MKRIVSILCALTVLVTVFSHPAEAATGMQGYAAYRDGVAGVIEWHAAIMDKASSDDIYPVIHADKGSNVGYAWWYEFMNGTEEYPYSNNNFIGYYRPLSNITSSQRDQVTATARSLAADFIGYTVWGQINYPVDNNPTGKTTVEKSDITAMRCDGVVEYCYEYNNVVIYPKYSSYWDISHWSKANYDEHIAVQITPAIQATEYMTLVSYNP